MAQKKITDLQLISAVIDGLNFPSDDGTQSYRATATQLATYMTAKLLVTNAISTAMLQDSLITRAKIAAAALPVPTFQKFTATGTQTGWLFTVTSCNATLGATYTNNSNTFTVLGTVSGSTLLWCSGTGSTSGSTLTKATGTGDSTITFSAKVALATYTTPANVTYIQVRMVGGGGAGGNSTPGNPGGMSTFGVNLLQAGGGAIGAQTTGTGGGAGGTASVGAASGIAVAGSYGMNGGSTTSGTSAGGMGGNSAFGGAGSGSGGSAQTNSGSGGCGSLVTNGTSYGGGGAGGFVNGFITAPAASYPYAIGAAGSAGSGSNASGAGAAGLIIVEEFYQ